MARVTLLVDAITSFSLIKNIFSNRETKARIDGRYLELLSNETLRFEFRV